ncbi:hypothetical protein FPV67DRAFT_1676452 [Lyophyllum atratum]|nr:hypothetical protein FPV67DRAFT_1676452 [Lyophyllum atratum]
MTPTIPEDIIEEVIEVLSTDADTLKSCSIVSRVFRVLCQRRLFHSVRLNAWRDGCNERLHHILLDNPVLVSFIYSLEVYVGENFCASRLKDVCGILHIVQSSIRELTISGELRHHHLAEPWNALHESLQAALVSVIAQPSCVYIKLGPVGLPINYLSEASHLRHLTLTHGESVTIPGEGISHSGHGDPKMQGYIKSLFVTSKVAAERILQTLHNPHHTCALSLSRLKVFKLSFIEPSCPLIQAILDLASDYLEEIILYSSFDISSYPDFARLTHLRELHLIFDHIPDMPLGACVIRIIETIPPGASGLGFQINEHPHSVIKDSEWHEIDALLAHERHATLRRVMFRGFKCEEGNLVEFFDDKMPRLAKKGVLVVTW